ncbi:hypothetical protein HYPSUDRAFT_72855 [Hypholoma sublateritium FD-334 SS-4]|uniref:C2H2-type domain-containing protein n=1 Tax=Hypholoma sublateritium (strain FD-334 SS-4) TaxID=945553 RepID=A0A0D2NB70_HYPSF|nr:hypothetical protein HYPSUDRAFT_72855 [Hypholoma sublateritium FD-334 SS-4]
MNFPPFWPFSFSFPYPVVPAPVSSLQEDYGYSSNSESMLESIPSDASYPISGAAAAPSVYSTTDNATAEMRRPDPRDFARLRGGQHEALDLPYPVDPFTQQATPGVYDASFPTPSISDAPVGMSDLNQLDYTWLPDTQFRVMHPSGSGQDARNVYTESYPSTGNSALSRAGQLYTSPPTSSMIQAEGSNIRNNFDATGYSSLSGGGTEALLSHPSTPVAQQKSIPCPDKSCGRIFTTKYRLKTHVNRFHTPSVQQLQYTCPNCSSYTTFYKTDLPRHRKKCRG